MAEHVDIPDGERHEPKGAGTATSGQVLKSTGNGGTGFGSVDYTEVTGRPAQQSAIADLASNADTATTVTKVNAILAALRSYGVIGT